MELSQFINASVPPVVLVCAVVNGLARHVTTVWLSRFINERAHVTQASMQGVSPDDLSGLIGPWTAIVAP